MAAALSDTQLKQFRDEGFTVAEDVFDPEIDFLLLKRDYGEILDDVAADLMAGEVIESYDPSASFSDRVIDVYQQAGDLDLQSFDIALRGKKITNRTSMYLKKAAFDLLRHPPLIDLVEQLLGPEVYSNPVQHIRLKVPNPADREGELSKSAGLTDIAVQTPWHQDNGVVTEDADSTEMLTVWVAVTDAPIAAGCLAVVRGSHNRGLVGHCPRLPSLTIPDELVGLENAVPVPMRAGSALLMTRHTMHRSLPNVSESIRWSFDLRYQPTGQPTGRKIFPGFVVRSKADPASVLDDHSAWVSLWEKARDDIAARDDAAFRFNRWKPDAPWCA